MNFKKGIEVMRIYLSASLLILASVSSLGQNYRKDELVTFKWARKNQTIATIQVPTGYVEETESYREGLKTMLTYPDGSYIILHIGGMIKLPFFAEPRHQVREKQILHNQIIRSGNVQNTKLFWREANSQRTWPPTNIGYTNVPANRLRLFEQSLSSFARAKQ